MSDRQPVGVVVGASSEALHALSLARNLGLYTIAMDGNPNAEGLAAADQAIVVDIRDPDALAAALEGTVPDVVIPVPIGRYLISGAALNDRFDLPGVRESAAQLCTDKWAFHRRLHPLGLRRADCRLLRTAADRAAAADFPLPAILKPRTGSGSRGVVRVDTPAARDAALAALPEGEEYLIETAVPGQEYGMDAVVIGGRFTPVLLRKKLNTPPPHCQCVGYFSQPAGTPRFTAAAAAVEQAAAALGVDNAVLHADLIEAPDGFFPIELSARPSGHDLHNLFTPLVTGIDMVENYLRFALGMPYNFSPRQYHGGLIRFFDFGGCTITSVPDEKDLMARYPLATYRCALVPGQRLDPVRDGSVMHRGYFVLRGDDEKELTALADALLAEFGREALV